MYKLAILQQTYRRTSLSERLFSPWECLFPVRLIIVTTVPDLHSVTIFSMLEGNLHVSILALQTHDSNSAGVMQIPGATYDYRIGKHGKVLQFIAAPETSPDARFKFIAYGDMGESVHHHAKSPGWDSPLSMCQLLLSTLKMSREPGCKISVQRVTSNGCHLELPLDSILRSISLHVQSTRNLDKSAGLQLGLQLMAEEQQSFEIHVWAFKSCKIYCTGFTGLVMP